MGLSKDKGYFFRNENNSDEKETKEYSVPDTRMLSRIKGVFGQNVNLSFTYGGTEQNISLPIHQDTFYDVISKDFEYSTKGLDIIKIGDSSI